MQAIIVDINEVRCNFCFNWICGADLVKKGFNSCNECLERYIKIKCQVHTLEGEIYLLRLIKRVKWSDVKQHDQNANIVQEVSEDMSQSTQQKKIIVSIQNHNRCKSAESELFDVKMSEIQRQPQNYVENLIDFVQTLTSKSQFLNRQDPQKVKPHQSCIFNTPLKQKQKNDNFSMKKAQKLQDYGRSLDKTRFLQRYQFFYDHTSIQGFIDEHPKIQQRSHKSKQFGNEVNSNQIERSVSLKNKIGKSISQRSNLSNDSHKDQKLQSEQIKMKISCFLQSRYHSESLTRIMTTLLKESYERTILQNKTLELINYKISNIDLYCYLNMFDFQHIYIVKLINVGLTDEQMPILVNYIWDKSVESLVLTGNKLTQNCLSVFLNKSLPNLKQLYLGNNRINKTKLKENIAQLHSKFILYL